MLPTIDGKESVNPVVVVQTPQETRKMSPTKKYVIIGVTAFFLIGIVIAAILVGMHIFAQSQKDILEYSLKLSGGRTQDVTSDVSGNVVKYHMKDSEHEAWIVSDFNKDIKATKILRNGETNCYLTPLNRSNAVQPSEISAPDEKNNLSEPKEHASLVYQTSGDPVTDISFLSKEARDMCKGVSTYWMYPSCNKDQPASNTTNHLTKREAPYYIYYKTYYNGVYYPCINGCCKTICACAIQYTWQLIGDEMYCTWVYRSCCYVSGYYRCFFQQFCEVTSGLVCTSGYC